MPEPSTSFSSLNPLPPRVVGIGYGIFETPENPLEPFVFTVPTTYSLYTARDVAPSETLGSSGDFYFRTTLDSLIIYQKTNKWTVFTTITGAASASLTTIYNDIATIESEIGALSASVTTISTTYATQAFAEAKKTEAITASNGFTTAAVSVESTARATADGFLEGKYTLKVVAGNVVTGMNITSSTGGGVDVSSVIFQANRFEIWNGASSQAVFSLVGSDVTISGWKINPNTLVGGQTTLNSTGIMTVGTGNDVAVMSSANATYRFWAGHANPALAPFSVTKDGFMFSSGATIVGDITFASTNRIIATDNASYLTWQGSAGLNVPGFYAQHETAAGGGLNLLAVGTNATSAVGLTKCRGAFGALTDTGSNDVIGTVFSMARTGGVWSTMVRNIHGITLDNTTPYYQVDCNGQMMVFNYDGKLYFAPTGFFDGPDTSYGAPYMPDALANIYRDSAGVMKTDAAFVADGDITSTGSFVGDGSSLTALNATQLTSGTVPDARFPATLPAISGANLTSLNASNISSGTLNNSRLSFSATGTGDVPINGFVNVGGVKLATVA